MVWTHNLSPFIFKWGPIALRWYGMAYVFGFVLAYMTLKRAIEAGKLPTMDGKKLESLLYGIILGVIGGGRLGFCVQKMDVWLKDPLFFFRVWEGGMAFFGGLVGVAIALFVVGKKYSLSLWALGDILAIPAAAALGVGRIANFINGELWGTPTHANWGIIYPKMDNVPRHPSELYEMVSHFALALIILAVSKSKWSKMPGVLASCFVAGYGFFRIFTEAFRSADVYVGPFTNGQVASFVTFVAGLGLLAWCLSAKSKIVTPAGSPSE